VRLSGKRIVCAGLAGFLGVCFSSCSDDDPIAGALEKYLILIAQSGTLEPANGGYRLVMENVSQTVTWYANRPSRETGQTTVQNLVQAEWGSLFGAVSPNAVLDCFIDWRKKNDGFFITLASPEYDPASDTLMFHSVQLDGWTTVLKPGTKSLTNLKLTVLPNCAGRDDCYSFVQLSSSAHFVPLAGGSGYQLVMEGLYPELYHVQHAPGTEWDVISSPTLASEWGLYFGTTNPNASLTSYPSPDVLHTALLELSNPAYDKAGKTFTYDASILNGESVDPGVTHSTPTLIIDDLAGTTIRIVNQTGSDRTLYIKPMLWKCDTCEAILKAWPECAATWDPGIVGCSVSIPNGNAGIAVPNPHGKHLNILFSLDNWPGNIHTQVENNVNDPGGYSNVDISLVNGWDYNVKIEKDGAVIAGPTKGAGNNKKVTGVFPWGCSNCILPGSVPPAGIDIGKYHDCKETDPPRRTSPSDTPAFVCQINMGSGNFKIVTTFTK